MSRPKILFLCNFSNPMIRDHVVLKKNMLRSLYIRMRHRKPHYDTDYAVWVSDFIEEFEKHPEYEFHIVAPIQTLKHDFQNLEDQGVFYHFYNCSYNLLKTIGNLLFNYEERSDYPIIRKRIKQIITTVCPDLVILCGAENPFYSIGVLDVKKQPIYVILQTLLNSSKRIQMGVGSAYKRRIEKEIFVHANYFCTSDEESITFIKQNNPSAAILPAGFPTHRPIVTMPVNKDYDYVFFAKTIAYYKGVEDLISALSEVKKKYPKVRLNIIGGISQEYKKLLKRNVDDLGLSENVHFAGLYQDINDTYINVAKAKAVVVPGKTGALNSTVRESMLMGLPTICYEVPGVDIINKDKECLMTAPMGNIRVLSRLMLDVIEKPDTMSRVAINGKEYATKFFSNSAIVNKLLDNCQMILKQDTIVK